jgi:hypothetical protein
MKVVPSALRDKRGIGDGGGHRGVYHAALDNMLMVSAKLFHGKRGHVARRRVECAKLPIGSDCYGESCLQ